MVGSRELAGSGQAAGIEGSRKLNGSVHAASMEALRELPERPSSSQVRLEGAHRESPGGGHGGFKED
jgi:hypothetical protein